MIVFQKNFFFLILAGFIFNIIGFVFKDLFFLQFVFYFCLLIFCLVDYFLIINKNKIEILRLHEKYLSIGSNNLIKIKINNNSNKKINLIVRDEYSKDFIVKDDTLKVNLNPYSYEILSYHVLPLKKGEYFFYNTFIRIQSHFKLFSKQFKVKNISKSIVYPNLIELKKYIKFISKNREEQIGYKKEIPGGEVEFDFLREYQAGDSYKKINWKATARKRLPITEVDQKEFNRNIMVILDTGKMMTTRYGFLTKLDFAINTSLILSASCYYKKDNFGMLSFSDKINFFLNLSKKNRSYTDLLSRLYKLNPDFNKSNYRMASNYLKNKVRKNCIIFVFSELYNRIVSKDLIDFLNILSLTHQVKFVSFEEFENIPGGNKLIDISQFALQQEHIIEKELIIKDLSKKGIATIRVNEKNIVQKVVNSYLSLK